MRQRIAGAVLSSMLALPVLAQTETAPGPAAAPADAFQTAGPQAASPQGEDTPAALQALEAAPSQVVVSGRRPGPGVWKVSKGNHVMWVFGVYSPLPRNMAWDAARVERLLAQSQVLLAPPSASAHVGFFKGLTLLPQLPRLIGIRKNPDGATLQEVLPAEVYTHWTALKGKYIGDDKDVERLRPLFAAQRLQAAGRDKSGLANGGVRDRIFQIAKANKVKVMQTGFEMKLDNVGKAIGEFKKNQLNDAACLAKTLDSLEQDLGAMQQRANAWANGNIAEIEGLDYTTQAEACDEAILSSAAADQANPDFRAIHERLRATWLDAAEKAMAENASTFAVLEMKDVFDPRGYLGALRAKGYTVESPK